MASVKTAPVITYEPLPLIQAKQVNKTAPFRWLAKGWQTFREIPGASMVFGGLFAVSGALISWASLQNPQFVFAFWSGFLLIAPILALVSHRMARFTQSGGRPSFKSCSGMLMSRPRVTLLFVVLLAVIMIAWVRASSLITALYAGNIAGSTSFITQTGSPEWLGFIGALFAVGGLFAALVFALSAWSMPMLADSRTHPVNAVASSVKAVTAQPVVMLLWAALIAVLTLVGMATAFVGFVVLFPVLGYATWHAYQELFPE